MPKSSVYDPEEEDIRPNRPNSESLSSLPKNNSYQKGSHWGEENKSKSVENSKRLSPKELGGAEAAASSGDSSESASQEANSINSNNDTFGYREEGNRKPKSKSRFSLRNLTKRKGLLVSGGLIGGLGVGLLLAFLFFSSLLIPGLAQHIAEWQFARITQQVGESVGRVSDESLAIEAEAGDKSIYDQIANKFTSTSAGAKASALWGQLDQYRPSKVIENLGGNSEGVKFNEATTSWGKTYLQSVELDGEEYQLTRQGFTRFIPALSSIIDFKNNVQFSQDFAPSFINAMKADDIGTVIRSATAKQIRNELGISLVAWLVGKYSGDDPTTARLQQAKDTDTAVDQGTINDNAVTQPIKDADAAAESAKQQCLSSDQCIQQAIDNGGIIQSVKDAVAAQLGKGILATITSIANPLYAVAMPMCIIYDGSLDNSGPTIDTQTAQQQRAFYYIESAGDQQKYGSPKVDTEAIGALNDDVNPNGQILQSNPEVRADGGTIDTSVVPSGEASADGQFTLLDATPGLAGPIAQTIDSIANKACPKLTNLGLAIGLALTNIVAGILSGGSVDAAEDTAGAAATDAADTAASDLASSFATQLAEEEAAQGVTKAGLGYYGRRFVGYVYDLGKTSAKQAALLTGVTVLAKIIVMNRAAQINNGLAQENDLVNEGDAGGNVAANEISRQGTYGRPLTISEVDQSHLDNKAFVAYQNSQRDVYQRYFALDNADSLLSRVGTDIYGFLYGKPLFASIFSSIGKIFNPSELVSGLFSSTSNNTAMAAASTDTVDYGNVQFGWSDSEEQLIDSDPSYMPLENQLTLDQTNCNLNGCTPAPNGNGTADSFISNLYGKCFTDSLGDLMSSGDITRDTDGNVIPGQGLCAPDNLGPNNARLGDMVFRWRLSQFYNNTVTQMSQEQAVGSPS